MAKDGTARGGARVGSGRKKKPLADKIVEGKAELIVTGHGSAVRSKMTPPSKMLSAKQGDGSVLSSSKIYKAVWNWLDERGCVTFVSPQLLERYAMTVGRWIQCEEAISANGLTGKHPTTGEPCASMYVAMSHSYLNQVNRLWSEIFQIIKDNCTGELGDSNPQDDVMERLLNSRKA